MTSLDSGRNQRPIWLTVRRAAELLDVTEQGLRARLSRAARRCPPGGRPISIGLGIVAERLGSHWRLRLPEEADRG